MSNAIAMTSHLDAFNAGHADQMTAHLRGEHGWTVQAHEETDRMFLLAAHLVAHQYAPPAVPDTHTCARGPLCAYWSDPASNRPGDPGACEHGSCMDMFMVPCLTCEDESPFYCPRHGWTRVTGGDSFTGFAGGTSYLTYLACGCTDADESGDVAAAR